VSTFTSEPGTRLGGRYRLEDRVAAAAGWAAWKAIDETLARAVTVLTFAPGFPRLREVVTAARSASRLTDSRFAQVFDIEDDWDHAYIVMEWASGESLDDMLAAGPLDAVRGARIIAEAADAMATAHAAGLAHLCLTPDCLRWTPGGGVKITGLGLDAALSDVTAEDPALADTYRLGMLLYAALTGHWPGPDWPALPPAPLADGLPCSPRQVRAGVPAALDEITSEAMLQRDHGAPPLTTPAQLAAALQAAIPPVPIPQLPQPPPRSRGSAHRSGPRAARETEYWAPGEPEPAYWSPDGQAAPSSPRRRESPPRRRSGTSGARVGIIAVLVAAVVAGLAVVAFHSLHGGHPSPSAATTPPAHTQTSTAAVTLTPVSAQAFEDNPTGANLAIDNNPASAWQTFWYRDNPVFGGLQQGSGLILDMGRSVRLSSVTVKFGPIAGAAVQIKIGNPSTPVPPQSAPSTAEAIANSMTTVAQNSDVPGGTVTFPVTSSASGRYVLIWFTKLPPMAGQPNKYQADIFNIVVKGMG
jgi:serine/threonine protein kinase